MSNLRLSSDVCMQTLRAWWGAQCNTSHAAQAVGLPRSTFQSRLFEAFKQYPQFRDHPPPDGAAAPAPPPVDEERDDRDRLAAQLKAARQDAASAREDALTAKLIRRLLLRLDERPGEPPEWISPPRTSSPVRAVPMTIWSDWHAGEVVREQEIDGLNRFDAGVMEARARRLVERTIDLCFSHQVEPDYPGLILNLGGDMITGDIHDELRATNDETPTQSVLHLADVLTSAIRALAEAFGRVWIPAVVGNHGRNTLKPRHKQVVHTSYEWLLYAFLERHFAGDDRVTWTISETTDVPYRVFGHSYFLTHGDRLGVKGGDGQIGAFGPILRGSAKVSRAEAMLGRSPDTILMGHWHQYVPTPGVIVNGTLKGYDEYARNALRAPYAPPVQALWLHHPRRRIIWSAPVHCDEPAPPASATWLEVAA